ncbi:hypothetical protein [Paenibacillus sp. KN14-4R]|uniref:hypothetical protein n=1 Tax=Paenibacillus sp. KN14-4R TaxID=3445773 RepID=UPI003FA1722F
MIKGSDGMNGEGQPGMDGFDGQSGMDGSPASIGANGQDVVSSTGSLNDIFMNQLLERLNSTHNQSLSIKNDDGRLQVMFNGVAIVDLDLNELIKNAQNERSK